MMLKLASGLILFVWEMVIAVFTLRPVINIAFGFNMYNVQMAKDPECNAAVCLRTSTRRSNLF